MVVQAFFSWRLWKVAQGFNKRTAWIVPSIILVLALAAWGIVITVGHIAFSSLETLADLDKLFPVSYVWFAFAM